MNNSFRAPLYLRPILREKYLINHSSLANHFREIYFLPLLLFSIWTSLAVVPIGRIQFIAYRWPISVLMGIWGLWLFSRQPLIKNMLWTMGGLLFIFYAFLSSTYSFIPLYTFLRATALGLLFLATVIAFQAIIKKPNDIYNVYLCMLVGALLTSILIYITGGMPEDIVAQGTRYRGVESLKATGVAQFAVGVIPLFYYGVHRYRGSIRLVLIAMSLFSFIILIASKGRAGIMTAALVFPLVWAGVNGRRLGGSFLLIAFSLAIFGYIAIYTNTGQVILRLDSKDLTTNRIERWEYILPKVLEKPLFGHGFGTNRYHPYEQSGIEWSLALNTRATQIVNHNEYISIFYDLGITGFAILWGALISVGVCGYRLFKMPHSDFRALLITIFATWLVQAMDTLSHDPLLTIGNPWTYWFWIKSIVIWQGWRMLKESRRRMTSSSSYRFSGNI